MNAKEFLENGRGASDEAEQLTILLERAKDGTLKYKAEIESVIEEVPERELRMLLRARYLEGKTWEKVAEAIHYESEYWVRTKLHADALNCVEEILRERACK